MEQVATVKQEVAEQYATTDQILTEFREYFPGIMTAAEYAEEQPREDLTIEQPPTAKEFVEQILAEESSSSEAEVEAEEEMVTEER